MNSNLRSTVILCSRALAYLCMASGCSSNKVTTEEVAYYTPSGIKVVERTITKEKTKEECGGLLSCTADATGDIVAAPFKAAGALVQGAL